MKLIGYIYIYEEINKNNKKREADEDSTQS